MWCTDSRNGCVVAGYCVEGTLAKDLINGLDQVRSVVVIHLTVLVIFHDRYCSC
jgi:hypothetical protein